MDEEEILKALKRLKDSVNRKSRRPRPPGATNVESAGFYLSPWGEIVELPAEELSDLEDENGSIVLSCSDGELVFTPVESLTEEQRQSVAEKEGRNLLASSTQTASPAFHLGALGAPRVTDTSSVSSLASAVKREEYGRMDRMWRFLRSAATLGCGLALAAIVLAAVAGGALYWRSQAVQRANDALAVARVWPDESLSTVGATFRLTTKWERESVWYQVEVDGYPPKLQYAREARDGKFRVGFLDAGGFEVFKLEIPLDEMTIMIGPDGTRSGFYLRRSSFQSADVYRTASSIDLTWSLREPPAPPPSTVPARRNPHSNSAAAPEAVPRWKDRSNWRQLKKGMTEDAVRALLGEPRKVDVLSFSTYWHYNYPYGGDVVFSSGAVVSWTEP